MARAHNEVIINEMKTESLILQEHSLNKSKTDCTPIAGVLFQESLYIKQLTLN